MSVINNIQNALNTELGSISGIFTIYWPNVEKVPTQGTSYVRPTLLPADGELYTLNDVNMHQGIYQIDIFVPLKKGTSPLLLIADSIREDFKTNNTLTSGGDTVYIQQINYSKAERIESWWSCYIQVNYICYN